MPLFLAPAGFVPRNLGWRSRFARRVFRVRSARFQNSSYSFFSQYGVLHGVRKDTLCQTGEMRQWPYASDKRAMLNFNLKPWRSSTAVPLMWQVDSVTTSHQGCQ